MLSSAGLTVVGTTRYGSALVDLVDATAPDIVLLELFLPDMSGLECIAALRERAPDVNVIVLSSADDQSSIDGALAMGAACYVAKTVDPLDIAATVRIIGKRAPIYHAGSPTVSTLRQVSAAASAQVGLTRREREMLQLASEGLSNIKIARLLWVTEQTVKFHLSNIYRKLEVKNRTQAAAKARSLGLTSENHGEATSLAASA